MPVRKTDFQANQYYHIMNRGIDNRVIFHDDQDVLTFRDSLVYYLKKLEDKPGTALSRTGLAYTGIFKDRLSLFAYCLLPTSFHLIFYQADEKAIAKLMQRVGTAYSMYFNRRHKRSGTLFQGRFKSKHIDTADYLMESTKYIHREPLKLSPKSLMDYNASSYPYYVNNIPSHPIDNVIAKRVVLDHLGHVHPGMSYQEYVEGSENIDWFASLTDWME